jgi:neugrin
MLPFFHRPFRLSLSKASNLIAIYSKSWIRLTHNSGKPSALRHRDWGVVGRLSRPPALSEEEPSEGVQDEEDEKKAVRYQTDNYSPISDPTPSRWAQHRASMKAKFPEGWAPPHKLSRAAMDGLRALHAHNPDTFTTPVLADKFRISPEAVRRILRGKWQPTQEQQVRLLERERRYRQDRIRSKRSIKRIEEIENKRRKTGLQT